MTTPTPAPAAAAPAPASPAGVVFIGKIAPTCTKADVEAFVAAAGTVKRVILKKYRHVETAQYAFAEFEDAASATKAIETLNGKELAGAAVVVEAARNQFPKKRNMRRKRKAAAPAAGNAAPANATAATTAAPATEKKRRPRRFNRRRRRVDAPISKDVAYVGNLPFIVDEEHMKEIFEGCKFIEARVVRRRDNRSKGFVFVTFANEADRTAAIEIANGSVVEGRKIRVCPARERVERTKTEENAAPAAGTAAPATPAQ